MPQSNHQTSPRLGGTLLLADYRRQLVASGSRHLVTERAGLSRRQVVNQLLHKLFFSSTASASNSESNFTVAAFIQEIYVAAG
jgi:hypothetical protein